MKKISDKGFSIPELLAVIVIMGILSTVAIASYNGISKSLKEKTYDNKISLIKTKAIEYAINNNIDGDTISVAKLIEDGYLEQEEDKDTYKRLSNPLGGYLDCYQININRNLDDYDVSVASSDNCELAKTDILASNLSIEAYDSETNESLGANQDIKWSKNNVYLYLNPTILKNNGLIDNEMTITWSINGNNQVKTGMIANDVSNNNEYVNVYNLETALLLNANVKVKIETDKGILTKGVNVRIDKEKPILTLDTNASYEATSKLITFNGSDGNGSGFEGYSYALMDNDSEEPVFNIENENNKKEVYVNKIYYGYARDMVGNISDAVPISITNIDNSKPVCKEPIHNPGWSTSYTYTYGCANDVGSGCATANKTETQTTDAEYKRINWQIKDNIGNTTDCSSNVAVHVDTTAPTCRIEVSGALGNNNWYISNVNLNLIASDNLSGISEYGITTNASVTYNNQKTTTLTYDTDRNGVTYYGYVKDKAGNTNTCQVTVKRLAEIPSCNIGVSGGQNGTEWYVSDVRTTINSSSKYLSSKKIINNNSENYTINYNTTGINVNGQVINEAGTKGVCSAYIKRDADAPDVDFTFKKTREHYKCDSYEKGCNDVESNIRLKGSTSGLKFAGVSDHNSSVYIGSEEELNACIMKYTGNVSNDVFNIGTIIYRMICMMQTFGDKTKWDYKYYSSPHTFVQGSGNTEVYYAKVCSNANVCKEVLAEITTPEPEQDNNSCSVLGGIVGGAGAGYVAGNIMAGFLGPIGFIAGVVGGAIVGGIACAMS